MTLAIGGKGYNPYRDKKGQFAPGAHKSRLKMMGEAVAKYQAASTAAAKKKTALEASRILTGIKKHGSADDIKRAEAHFEAVKSGVASEQKLKLGQRYAARAKHWAKKAEEAHASGNAAALAEAKSKAALAHKHVEKHLGKEHALTHEARQHMEKAQAVGAEKPKPIVQKIAETPKPTIPTSAPPGQKLSADAEKKAKRYAARAKHWRNKAKEASEKAQQATTDAEKKLHEVAAAHAAKKAAAAHKLVEKAAGEDHPLTEEAKYHADAAQVHAGVAKPKAHPHADKPGHNPQDTAYNPEAPIMSSGKKPTPKVGDTVLDEHGSEFTIEHIGGTNVYGSTSSGIAIKTAKSNLEGMKVVKSAEVVKDADPTTPPKYDFAPHGGGEGKVLSGSAWSKMSSKQREALSHNERSAVLTYSGGSYRAINGKIPPPPAGLRSGVAHAGYEKTIAHLDSAFEKSAVKETLTVFRGVAGSDMWDHYSKYEVGGTIQDAAYQSTSHDIKKIFKKDIKMTITLPKGARGIAMNSELSHHDNEGEILLPRGTKYRITKIEKDESGYTKKMMIHAEVIP